MGLSLPHPEEPAEGGRLEGWAACASGATCVLGPWFETRRCATLLTMRRSKFLGHIAAASHRLAHAPEERHRALRDAVDGGAPGVLAQVDAERRVDRIVERGLVEPPRDRLLVVERGRVEP